MKNPMENLKGKVAIVTGGTSGIGWNIVKVLSEYGVKVVATGRRKERLDQQEAEAKVAGLEVVGIAADLLEADAPDKVVDFAMGKFGHVDILVNNAGIIDQCYLVPTMPDKVMEDVFTTNVYAPLRFCRRLIPIMEEQEDGGSIINISSMCGMVGFRGGPVYTASKHAITGLTKNMAYMYSGTRVRINAINPGNFPTEVLSRWATDSNDISTFIKDKRFKDRYFPTLASDTGEGDPRDIGQMIAFIASGNVPFLNGAAIAVDNAWSVY